MNCQNCKTEMKKWYTHCWLTSFCNQNLWEWRCLKCKETKVGGCDTVTWDKDGNPEIESKFY